MKQTIKIGGREAELDLLTKEELHSEIEGLISGYLRPPLQSRPDGGIQLSAAGAGIAEIYVVPAGMQFRLTRVFVTANNATFGAPLAGAGGIDVYRGIGSTNDPQDGTPFSTLPQVATWSKHNGPLYRDGEAVRVGIVGGPANGQLYARAAGFLEPMAFDAD